MRSSFRVACALSLAIGLAFPAIAAPAKATAKESVTKAQSRLLVGLQKQSYLAEIDKIQKEVDRTDLAVLQDAVDFVNPRGPVSLGIMQATAFDTQKSEAEAFEWYERDANAGNPASMNVLAIAYARGLMSAPRDILKARSWAEKSAQLGDKDGQYLFYQTVLQGPEWNYRDANGKVNQQKYSALAKRSLADRELDRQAYSMLSRSAEQGNSNAIASVVATLLVKTAPNTSKRALQIIDRAPISVAEKFQSTRQLLTLVVEHFGDTYASLSTFKDAVNAVYLVARVRAGLRADEVCEINKGFTLNKIRIARPLADEEYLPIESSVLRNFYLIKGNWRESWEVDVCGRVVSVPVEFQADGLGGANFQALSK